MTLKLTITDTRPDHLPQTLLDIAAEVESVEAQLKQQILEAARAGDTGRVIDIVTRWLDRPPAEVLSQALIPAGESR
jgi:hypothetical protein